MNKNKVNCLIISDSPQAKLKDLLMARAESLAIETMGSDFLEISHHLRKQRNQIVIMPERENYLHLEKIRKLLSRYSKDTLLVVGSTKNTPIIEDIRGIDTVEINISKTSPECFAAFISYANLKKHFRQSKQLLRHYDQLNRWLVKNTQQAFAYIHKGTHVLANQAWMSLFGFSSTAELLSTDFMELVPKANQAMLNIQMKNAIPGMQKKFVLTLMRFSGQSFRAELRMSPAVINNIRCLQVGIQPLQQFEDNESNLQTRQLPSGKDPATRRPVTLNKPAAIDSPLTVKTLLQLPSARRGIKLYLQPYRNDDDHQHNFFQVQMHLNGKLLSNLRRRLPGQTLNAFIDELLMHLVFEHIQNKGSKNSHYILSPSSMMITNKDARAMLFNFLTEQPEPNSPVHLLFPASLLKKHFQQLLQFQQELPSDLVKVGIRSYEAHRETIARIKKLNPSVLSFSDRWLSLVHSSYSSERKLDMLIRNLEDAGIQVILPP